MKFIRIDMTQNSVLVEQSPDKYRDLGGRGLTSTLLADEVDPRCYALGKDNKLVIAPGLLTGTSAPCSARTSIGAKSPLTGGIKESNVGGIAGQHLAGHGIKALIIEGKPAEKSCCVVVVSGEGVTMSQRDELAGLGNYEVVERMRNEYGATSAVISVGPAGEAGASLATVAVGDMEGWPVRHAARGGMGAVLGSKGVKAIVLLRPASPIVQPANPELFAETVKSFAASSIETKKALTTYGSAVLTSAINSVGGLPTRNFSTGKNADIAGISGERLLELCKERGGSTGHACSRGCVIRCSNVFNNAKGEYVTGGMEYETIALLGSNCGINDLDSIAQLDRLCDDFGIDTMEIGVTLGVAMEAGLFPFGDFEAMQKAITQTAKGEDLGRVFGQGATLTGKVLGVERVPAVRGQSLAGYDPRTLKGMGVTYATSTMGADHTSGPCMPGRGGVTFTEAAGQIDYSRLQQKIAMLVDLLGICLFAGAVAENLPAYAAFTTGLTGREVTEAELLEQAESILSIEKDFNHRAGLAQNGNDLPSFFRTEALPNNGLVFDVPASELEAI